MKITGSHRATRGYVGRRALTSALVLVAATCVDDTPTATVRNQTCDLNPDLLFSSLPPDRIPALSEPEMVSPDDPGADYLLDSDRVLGVYMNGEARAYPHNILWHHEIVNDQIGGDWISVTFCPLTGSGLAFDPQIGSRRLDIGVSGLLFAALLAHAAGAPVQAAPGAASPDAQVQAHAAGAPFQAAGKFVERAGRLEVVIADYFDSGTTETFFLLHDEADDQTVELKLSTPPENLRTGQRIVVRGFDLMMATTGPAEGSNSATSS